MESRRYTRPAASTSFTTYHSQGLQPGRILKATIPRSPALTVALCDVAATHKPTPPEVTTHTARAQSQRIVGGEVAYVYST
jgi:hypothetical protein